MFPILNIFKVRNSFYLSKRHFYRMIFFSNENTHFSNNVFFNIQYHKTFVTIFEIWKKQHFIFGSRLYVYRDTFNVW